MRGDLTCRNSRGRRPPRFHVLRSAQRRAAASPEQTQEALVHGRQLTPRLSSGSSTSRCSTSTSQAVSQSAAESGCAGATLASNSAANFTQSDSGRVSAFARSSLAVLIRCHASCTAMRHEPRLVQAEGAPGRSPSEMVIDSVRCEPRRSAPGLGSRTERSGRRASFSSSTSCSALEAARSSARASGIRAGGVGRWGGGAEAGSGSGDDSGATGAGRSCSSMLSFGGPTSRAGGHLVSLRRGTVTLWIGHSSKRCAMCLTSAFYKTSASQDVRRLRLLSRLTASRSSMPCGTTGARTAIFPMKCATGRTFSGKSLRQLFEIFCVHIGTFDAADEG